MSLGEDADNRSMSLTLLILVLSFSVYAGQFIGHRTYEHERIRVMRPSKTAQDHLIPKPEEIGFRSYATELRPQRLRLIKPKRRELSFGRR